MQESTRALVACPQRAVYREISRHSSTPEAVATDPGVGPPAGEDSSLDGSGGRAAAALGPQGQPEGVGGSEPAGGGVSPVGARGVAPGPARPQGGEAEGGKTSGQVSQLSGEHLPESGQGLIGFDRSSPTSGGGVTPPPMATDWAGGQGTSGGQASEIAESDGAFPGAGADDQAPASGVVQGTPDTPPPTATPGRARLPVGPGGLRVVGARVDYFLLAYKFAVIKNEVLWDVARDRSDAGWESAFELGGVPCKLTRKAHAAWVLMRNADMIAKFDVNERDGWALEIDFSAMFLATHTLAEAIAVGDRLAQAVGPVLESRLRRADLAVDVAGWEIRPHDVEKFLLRRSEAAKYTEVEPGEDEAQRGQQAPARVYSNKRGITGITIGKGDSMLRVYDKRTELLRKVSEHKRDQEEAGWRANGWDGSSCITRVEFQIRGEAMKSFIGADKSPALFVERLDAIWQNLVRKWTRMVVLNQRTRKRRCALDPRWELLQAVVFEHTAQPAKRTRMRGGADPVDTFSRMLSGLAGQGELPVLQAKANDTDGELEAVVADVYDAHCRLFLVKLRARGQRLPWVQQKVGSMGARYASVDDLPPPPTEAATGRGRSA